MLLGQGLPCCLDEVEPAIIPVKTVISSMEEGDGACRMKYVLLLVVLTFLLWSFGQPLLSQMLCLWL